MFKCDSCSNVTCKVRPQQEERLEKSFGAAGHFARLRESPGEGVEVQIPLCRGKHGGIGVSFTLKMCPACSSVGLSSGCGDFSKSPSYEKDYKESLRSLSLQGRFKILCTRVFTGQLWGISVNQKSWKQVEKMFR